MAEVDPEDDSILRYVVRHYRYDSERHERRHVTIAAFDSEPEFERAMDLLGARLREAKSTGDADPREHLSGILLEPGHEARARHSRLVARAIQRGATPPRSVSRNLPGNRAVARFRTGD